MSRVRLNTVLCLVFLAFSAARAHAGLREISPRPQQMGLLTESPVFIPGGLYLVIPNNPTEEEIWIKDALVAAIEQKTFRRPSVIFANQANNHYPAIWLGTAARFPALAQALDSTEIDGLGQFTHPEEYHIYVTDSRIFACGGDIRGMRYAGMSLPYLFAEVYGSVYVDRAYVRDWPFWTKRIATCNSSIRDADQRDYCHYIVDNAYAARFNEIEWNSSDAGNDVYGRPQVIADALALRDKIKQFGMALTMSCDRTAYEVYDPSWQEGVPIHGTKMRVTATTFVPITGAYNIGLVNGNFESWTGNRPNNYSMNPEGAFAWVSRDQTIRHGGTSSVKWTGFTGSLPGSLELQQHMVMGSQRWIRAKIWYKTNNFYGRLRFKIFGPPPAVNACDFREIIFYNETHDWSLWEIDFSTFHVDSTLILVGPDIAINGTCWIDDITFEVAEPVDMVRRSETPCRVFKLPANQLMIEGYDYQITESASQTFANFFTAPSFARLAGGRLAVNDSVSIDYYSAIPYENGKQTPCWTNVESLQNHQRRVRNTDSLFRPDGYKIHINEVSFAGFDPTCVATGLSPAALVAGYCRDMYNIIQAQRPNIPVRIYGDPFDLWCPDPRAMPVTYRPWNIGAAAILPAPLEVMNQASYTENVDSAFVYFHSTGHPTVIALDGNGNLEAEGFSLNLRSAITATHYPECRGLQFYDYTLELYEQLGDHGRMAWNLGPYFLHMPVRLASGQSSVVILSDIWTDTLQQTNPVPSIPQRTVRYRLLPAGAWQQATLAPAGTDAFAATIGLTGATGIEYYLEATDHRGLTKTCPATAPTHTFRALLPVSEPPAIRPEREEVEYGVTSLGGFPLIEWATEADVQLYEVRLARDDATRATDMQLVSRQSPQSPRFLFADARFAGLALNHVHVYAVRETKATAPTSK